MAICYECKTKFYGYYCPNCDKKVIYKCWNCKATIDIEESEHCKKCGWYHCRECDMCGCDESRPLSKEEEAELNE